MRCPLCEEERPTLGVLGGVVMCQPCAKHVMEQERALCALVGAVSSVLARSGTVLEACNIVVVANEPGTGCFSVAGNIEIGRAHV